MKLNIKLISALLAFVMLFGTFTSLFTVSAFAEEAATEAPDAVAPEEEEEVDYTKIIYATPNEKLASMKLMVSKAGYELYADAVTGEVAARNTITGEILFTNPYDVATSKGSEDTKYEIMSQIIVNYVDNGSKKVFTSYEMAALRDQIKVKNIKNGIRVEYTIGREEARRLVPRLVEKNDFETTILDPLIEYYGLDPELKLTPPIQQDWFYYKKLYDFYTFMSLDNCATEKLKADMLKNFPITEKMDVYVLDPNVTTVQLEELEGWIKSGCPSYSYEEMDAQHQKTEYQGEDENPPLFKMALEYTIGNDGAISVRLPANGLRFNESKYQLDNISILPYMGAGNNTYDGYTFYPDGSGALFTFDDLNTATTTTISSKMYGVDYAYHKITGTYQENITYPVFGVVEDTEYYDITIYDEAAGEEKIVRIDGAIYKTIMDARENETPVPTEYKIYESYIAQAAAINKAVQSRGYVGIIEEGDAMADLATYHAGSKSNYNTIQMYFNPRPKDSYNLADAISVGANDEWTVVSSRKYVGNYKIRYMMLTDEGIAKDKNLAASDYYKTSWLGMAFAYRDYLVDKGVLSKLTDKQTSGDIPMYIEAFGAMEAVEKIMSIPITVTKPLTSFENIKTMYKELADNGVSEINFKLTGYANGGIYSTMPSKVDWEKVVEEDMDFQELLDYAKDLESGELGIFPDFDFSFIKENTLFDAVVLSKHAIKTIDDRYTTKRVYSATQQRYMGYGELAISPAYFDVFYEDLVSDYGEYDNIRGMSVGTLGSTLNSDFDEDEPYNREDSKSFVTKALEYLSSKDNGDMEIMVDSGNAYTWKYVDHILGVALDSSRYIQASYSVPFIGVVLHGYMNFAGDPLNMEGDVNYAMLKAIENGASIYFTLSYDNTEILKEDEEYSKYYSIRYDIWRDDVAEIYDELNKATKDVQDKLIIDHEFLSGTRIPDSDELYFDVVTEFDAVLDYQKNKAEYEAQKKTQAVADARELIANTETVSKEFIQECVNYYSLGSASNYNNSYDDTITAYIEANCAFMQLKAVYDEADEETRAALKTRYEAAEKLNASTYTKFKNAIKTVSNDIYKLEKAYDNLSKLLRDAEEGRLVIEGTKECPESIILEIKEQLANIEKYMSLEIGLKINSSIEAFAVNTFIDTHLSLLVNGQRGTYVEDYAENLLRLMESEKFGLTKNDLGLLRYIEANKKLTDDELVKKYKIDKDGKELYGIVLYIRELLGNVKGQKDPAYTFDPALSDEGDWSEVDKAILNYYMSSLYRKISSMSDSVTLPVLNFVPTTLKDNEIVSNKSNIDKVTAKAINAIRAAISDIVKPGGTYDHTNSKTNAVLNDARDEAVSIIESDVSVKYATPATLEDDVKALVVSVFYQEVLKKNYKADEVKLETLLVTKKYDVKTSIENLYKNRIEPTYIAEFVSQEDTFKAVFEAIAEDKSISAALDKMAGMLKDGYGDVREALETSLYKKVAEGLGKKVQKAYAYHFADPKTAPKTADLDKEIKAAAIAITDIDAQLNIVADEFVAKLSAYAYKDGEDLRADIVGKINYYYYANLVDTLKKGTVASYYYDPMIGAADAQLDALIAEHGLIANEKLASATDKYEKLNILFEMLADGEYDVVAKTAAISKLIEYYPTITGKTVASLEEDALSIYLYGIISACKITTKVDDAPIKKLVDDGTKVRSAIYGKVRALAKELVKTADKRGGVDGGLPNYSFASLMTDAQLDAFVNELVEALDKNMAGIPEDTKELKAALRTYTLEFYYDELFGNSALGIKTAPTFSVEDFYGNGLYEESLRLKELLRYFATTLTPLTEGEIENMILKDVDDGDDDDDYSKYATSKGKLVAVTYGSVEENGDCTAYKTFLLNYNNFYTKVTYGGVEYTISPYGFVTVPH